MALVLIYFSFCRSVRTAFSLQRSSHLAAAFVAHVFVSSLLEALDGVEAIIETCFVKNYQTASDYLSIPVLLGVRKPFTIVQSEACDCPLQCAVEWLQSRGIARHLDIPESSMTSQEREELRDAVRIVQKNSQWGENFVCRNPPPGATHFLKAFPKNFTNKKFRERVAAWQDTAGTPCHLHLLVNYVSLLLKTIRSCTVKWNTFNCAHFFGSNSKTASIFSTLLYSWFDFLKHN